MSITTKGWGDESITTSGWGGGFGRVVRRAFKRMILFVTRTWRYGLER